MRAGTSATVLGCVKRWVLAMLARKNGLRGALLSLRAFDPPSTPLPSESAIQAVKRAARALA